MKKIILNLLIITLFSIIAIFMFCTNTYAANDTGELEMILDVDDTNFDVSADGYLDTEKGVEFIYTIELKDTEENPVNATYNATITDCIGTRDISAKAFLQLDKLNNVEIYCLTKGINDDNFSEFKNNKVINIAKKFNHFGDTAAAIENCDIIISADNCILNLAGAMGKKTFGVFNWTYEFRWYKFIEENPQDVGWYTSVKPYICDDIDHWEKPIERIIRDIKPLLK